MLLWLMPLLSIGCLSPTINTFLVQFFIYNLVGATFTGLVQEPLAVTRLDNRLFMSSLDQTSFKEFSCALSIFLVP